MMHFKLLFFFALFFAVECTLSNALGGGKSETDNCVAGEPHCCNQLFNKNKIGGLGSILSTIIGPVSDLFESFSLNCVPINAIGTSSSGCVVQNACCTAKQQGIIVFACNNINAAG